MKLPYTHNKKLNRRVSIAMNLYKFFLKLVKILGFDVRLFVNANTLGLYFNDDYPDLILVDKYLYEDYIKQDGECE